MIAKGEIEVRPDWVTAGIKTARIIEGIMIGIPIGIYEQAKDTVTGIWDLIKSIFSGEILDQLVDLYNALWEMDWEDVKKLLWGLLGVDPDKFDEIWNSKNITTVERYKFIGEIIGRLIFEIILMVFTGGVALAKYGAKIPALAKLASSLKKVEKIIPDNVANKLRKKKQKEVVVPAKKKKPRKKTWQQHELDVTHALKKKYGEGNVASQVTLEVTGPGGKKARIRIDNLVKDEKGNFKLIDAKHSNVNDLTSGKFNLDGSLTNNQKQAFPWIKDGEATRIEIRGVKGEKLDLNSGDNILNKTDKKIEIHVNDPIDHNIIVPRNF